MKIKYSPCRYDRDTQIVVQDENTVLVDGDPYEFDPFDVAWPKINEYTLGVILEAYRENGELFLTIRRFYSGSCMAWDSIPPVYHEVQP